MNLKDFSLVSFNIPIGEILRAIEVAIPAEAIEQVIVHSQAQERRTRALPAHLVVCFFVILAWSSRWHWWVLAVGTLFVLVIG